MQVGSEERDSVMFTDRGPESASQESVCCIVTRGHWRLDMLTEHVESKNHKRISNTKKGAIVLLEKGNIDTLLVTAV